MTTCLPTPAMGLTERERELRQNFIGASETAAILGVNPYATAADVYHQKVDGIAIEETRPMQIGRLFEPLLLDFAAEILESSVSRANRRRVHPNGFMQATIDGFVVGRNEIVEAKKVMYFSYLKDKSAWGDQWTDQIPRQHIVQVQHQLAVLTAQTGEPWNTAWVAVCIGDDDWRMYQVQRLAELCDHIEQAVGRFWNEHVLPRVPPTDSLPSADILARIPRAKDSIMPHLDPMLVRPYLDARSRKEQAEADMDEAKARIVTAMGPRHDEARTDGGTTVTYRQAKRATFDKKGLIAAHPQIAASFTGTGSSPRFCVTPGADLLTQGA